MGDASNEGQVKDNMSGEGEGLEGSGRNNMDSAKEKLDGFDWVGLEERFWGRMEECRRVEEGVTAEFGELVEVGIRLLLFLRFHVVRVRVGSGGGGFSVEMGGG